MKARKFIPLTEIAAIALALVSALWAPSGSANTTVYRCLDAHLDVVYTDLPCKEGSAFEVRPGEADPVAVAHLEKLRDQLDQSAAQRISEERRLYAQRQLAYTSREQSHEETSDYAGGYYTYPVAGYGAPNPPYARPPRDRLSGRHFSGKHGGAPSPPYVIPRR